MAITQALSKIPSQPDYNAKAEGIKSKKKDEK